MRWYFWAAVVFDLVAGIGCAVGHSPVAAVIIAGNLGVVVWLYRTNPQMFVED